MVPNLILFSGNLILDEIIENKNKHHRMQFLSYIYLEIQLLDMIFKFEKECLNARNNLRRENLAGWENVMKKVCRESNWFSTNGSPVQ